MNRYDLLRRILALRCEESTLLASRERDEPLGLPDRLAMWGHLLACRSCRRFRRQLRQIGEAYRRLDLARDERRSAGEGLRPESRRRIEEALRRAADEGPRGEGTP